MDQFHETAVAAPASWEALETEIAELRGRVATLEEAARRRDRSLTLVVFSGDMDRAQAAFNIATGAAALGIHATMFFTFWGLSVVTKPDAAPGRGLLRRGFRFLHRPGAARRPLSRFNLFGLGPRLFGILMRESRVPPLEEQITLARSLGVSLVACTVTMGLLGVRQEDIRPEVESFAGVVTYLTEARASGVSLFV